MISTLLIAVALAAPSPTPTRVYPPEAWATANAIGFERAWANAEARKAGLMWEVTATATATPKPPRLSQAKLEATCVAGGHRWFEGDGFILERASDRVVGFPVPAYWAAYCRRCGLWKEVKP